MIKLKKVADGIPNFGYLLISFASLVVFLISLLPNLNYKIADIGHHASLIFLYSSLGLIIKNSMFNKSNFYRFFLLSVSFLLIAILFKILHIDFSIEMFVIAFSFMLLSYAVYFFKKKNKSILDYFKLIYFSSFIILKLITVSHYSYYNEIWLINFISTLIVVILIYFKYKNSYNWFSQ